MSNTIISPSQTTGGRPGEARSSYPGPGKKKNPKKPKKNRKSPKK